jgi:hypothetical protein
MRPLLRYQRSRPATHTIGLVFFGKKLDGWPLNQGSLGALGLAALPGSPARVRVIDSAASALIRRGAAAA